LRIAPRRENRTAAARRRESVAVDGDLYALAYNR
jgi:hypothetical protein